MRQFEVSQFLSKAQEVTLIAKKIRDAILSASPETPFAEHITYSPVPDQPLNIYADVLNIRHILRLEYTKYTLPNGELVSARYVDIGLVAGNEVRGDVLAGIVAPNHLLLPDDEILEIPVGGDDNYHVSRARKAITQALLASVISSLPKWTRET